MKSRMIRGIELKKRRREECEDEGEEFSKSLSLALGAANAWVDAELQHFKNIGGEVGGELAIIGFDPSFGEYKKGKNREVWKIDHFDWQSELRRWMRIPGESDHLFRRKATTRSDATRPPIPI